MTNSFLYYHLIILFTAELLPIRLRSKNAGILLQKSSNFFGVSFSFHYFFNTY